MDDYLDPDAKDRVAAHYIIGIMEKIMNYKCIRYEKSQGIGVIKLNTRSAKRYEQAIVD